MFLYKTQNQGYQLLRDLTIHNIELMPKKKTTLKGASINIVDHESTEDVASILHNQRALERKIEELTNSLHAIQVGCNNIGDPI